MAADIVDSRDFCGPAVQAVLVEATTDLAAAVATTKTVKDKPDFDAEKRATLRSPTDALRAVLRSDDVVRAAWRDLVDGCKLLPPTGPSAAEMTHRYETLAALLALRIVDLASLRWALIRALTGEGLDIVLESAVLAPEEGSRAPADTRVEQCEQLLIRMPEKGNWIVWLRFDNAILTSLADQRYGQVTFDKAQQLASWLYGTQHRTVLFDTTPSELIEAHVVRPEPDDYHGFEPTPKMVYARIELQDIEGHRAAVAARGLVSAIVAETNPEVGYWQLLGGQLVLAHGQRTSDYRLEWGRKQPLQTPMYAQNDRVSANLRDLSTFTHTINPTSSLIPEIARHRSTLASIPEDDPEAIIVTAVRAIEHCNVWATNAPGPWHGFVRKYLRPSMVRLRLLEVATDVAFAASRTTLAPDERERARRLLQIERQVSVRQNGHAASDRIKLLAVLPDLAEILADHPRARAVGDMKAVFTDPEVMRSEVALHENRFEAQLQRLIRLRNAAIHGGPTSLVACASVRPFARTLAFHSLTLVSRALLDAAPVDEYFSDYLTRNTSLLKRVCSGSDPADLITSDSVSTVA